MSSTASAFTRHLVQRARLRQHRPRDRAGDAAPGRQRRDALRLGATTLRDGIVALSPGATSAFAAVDLSAASAAAAGGAGAVGERFASERSFDLAGAARVFYSEFGDNYDQLVFWTDTRVTDADTFAFESTVKNAIRGIGQDMRGPGRGVRQRRAGSRASC